LQSTGDVNSSSIDSRQGGRIGFLQCDATSVCLQRRPPHCSAHLRLTLVQPPAPVHITGSRRSAVPIIMLQARGHGARPDATPAPLPRSPACIDLHIPSCSQGPLADYSSQSSLKHMPHAELSCGHSLYLAAWRSALALFAPQGPRSPAVPSSMLAFFVCFTESSSWPSRDDQTAFDSAFYIYTPNTLSQPHAFLFKTSSTHLRLLTA
jgi:hypothetical protein